MEDRLRGCFRLGDTGDIVAWMGQSSIVIEVIALQISSPAIFGVSQASIMILAVAFNSK